MERIGFSRAGKCTDLDGPGLPLQENSLKAME